MDWHSRFRQQATWTRDLRVYLFDRAGLHRARRVLEVGCGTGAILADITTPGAVHGLDQDRMRLGEARVHAPTAAPVCGDALALPYPGRIFDVTFCHFLLLWVKEPLSALLEMKRVTRAGGAVLALAEPDYDSRVDKPDELAPLGRWQAESLRQQGADPALGRSLAALFKKAGIQPLETKSLAAGTNSCTADPVEWALEWAVLEDDLRGRVPDDEIQRMKALDIQAREQGKRVLYVPTYFAWGVV